MRPGAAASCFISSPPIVAGFLLPIPRGGSDGVLSGLFFGGIICHLPILSACVDFLVPSRHGRRIIKPLQGRYRPYTGRFPGVASCTTPGAFARPAPSGQLPWGQGSTVAVIQSPENPPIFRRKFERFFSRNFFSDFSLVIVANNSRLKVAAKVAEQTPESRKTSGGIFIVAIVD